MIYILYTLYLSIYVIDVSYNNLQMLPRNLCCCTELVLLQLGNVLWMMIRMYICAIYDIHALPIYMLIYYIYTL